MYNFRTDLADERENIIKNIGIKKDNKKKINKDRDNKITENNKINNSIKIDGIESDTKKITDNLKVTVVKVLNEDGSKKIQKKIGTYTTINIGDIEIISKEELEKASELLSEELKKLIKSNQSILVVGLGNEDTTADSLGPTVIKDLEITRHILKYKPELLPKGTREVSAIAPGVLGNTGIETQEILKGIIEKINPSMLIVIDALMSTDIERLLKTIQVSDTGIVPGAGVGNNRKELSIDTLGIPVISIGVPTIVDAATIVANSIDIMAEKFNELSFFKDATYEQKYRLMKDVLEPTKFNLAVMPKEIDQLVDNMQMIISNGINQALS